MTIATTLLTSGGSPDVGAEFTTASIAPTANRLVLACIMGYTETDPPPTPTASGGGMTTWTQVATAVFGVANSMRLTIFRALQASPGSGTVTFDFGAPGTDFVIPAWIIFELSNVKPTGTNGADAIVQQVTGADDASSLTLAAFSDVLNATVGVWAGQENTSFTVGSGFTQVAQVNSGGPQSQLVVEFKSTNDTSVDVTGGPTDQRGMGLEIAHAVAGGANAQRRLMMGIG